MTKIEDCTNPIIGEHYLVRCVLVKGIWRPVFDKSHCDNPKHALPEEHYHQDWRFVLEEHILAQRLVFSDISLHTSKNVEYYAPIMKSNVEDEQYKEREYFRHFEKFYGFLQLRADFKKAKMKNMICPHHKTNLKSCRIINGIVQCPQHGLKWNVKTGDLL